MCVCDEIEWSIDAYGFTGASHGVAVLAASSNGGVEVGDINLTHTHENDSRVQVQVVARKPRKTCVVYTRVRKWSSVGILKTDDLQKCATNQVLSQRRRRQLVPPVISRRGDRWVHATWTSR